MPLTLYLYILRELAKLLVTSTAVLVVVMSVGSAIKPISEGLLGPVQLATLIVYTMPGMLTFALPFAAAFSSTIVFFRMSTDNEITACAVSGISYRELLLPVLGLALVLTLSMFYLSNWVVPRFWRNVARIVEQDVTGLVIQRIERREPVELGNNLIVYADRARDNVPIEPTPPDQPRPYNRMELLGVAVARINYIKDPAGAEEVVRFGGDLTARRAVVDLYTNEEEDRTFVTMMLEDVVVNDASSGTLVSAAFQPIEAQEIESPFQQKPQFFSLPRLRQVADNPDLSAQIRKHKRTMVEALGVRRLVERLGERLAGGGALNLDGPQGQTYVITAPKTAAGERRLDLVGADGRPVRVQVTGAIGKRQDLSAEAGRMDIVAGELNDEPIINITLDQVTITDPALPTRKVQRKQAYLPLLRWDKPLLEPLRRNSSAKLLEQGASAESPSVERARATLDRALKGLLRDITSRLHERAAFAVNCLLVLLLGAVMSMTLRRQTPLVIFFWCFVPTVVAFLTITSGQGVLGDIDQAPALGIGLIWSGNVALGLMTLGVYLKLHRN